MKFKIISTILIKSRDKKNDKFLLELSKRLRLHAKALNADNEYDLLLIKSIDEGIKSGEGSRKEVKKILSRNGAKICQKIYPEIILCKG